MNNPYNISDICKYCSEQEREDCESSQMCSYYEKAKALHDAWEEGYKEGVEEVKALRVANLELVKQLKEARNGCPTETQIKKVLARYQHYPNRYVKTLLLSEVAKIIKAYWKQDDETDYMNDLVHE